MPIPWLLVLQSVTWTDVIKNAPKVAEGAKKLWSAVGKKAGGEALQADGSEKPISAEALTVPQLQARLAALELATDELHHQMLASSELIKTLAEQNTQLIAHIETNRVRFVWLAGATAAIALVAVISLFLALAG